MSDLIQLIVNAGVAPYPQAAEIFGCRQQRNGHWTRATIGDDRAFVHPTSIDPAYEPLVAKGHRLLLEDIRGFAAFPLVSQVIVYDLDAHTIQLTAFGQASQTVSLDGQDLFFGQQWMGTLGKAYNEAALSFLGLSGNERLAGYVDWYMRRRDAILAGVVQTMPPIMGQALFYKGRYGLIPWPWEMADSYTIDAYLFDLAAAGSLGPAPTPDESATSQGSAALGSSQSQSAPGEPAETPTTADADRCVALGYWLGETEARMRLIYSVADAVAVLLGGGGGAVSLPNAGAAGEFANVARFMDDFVAQQEASKPPTGAGNVNDKAVEVFKEQAGAFRVFEEAAKTGDGSLVTAGRNKRDSITDMMADVDAGLVRLEDECGINTGYGRAHP